MKILTKIFLISLWLCVSTVLALAQDNGQGQNGVYNGAPVLLIGSGTPAATLAVGGVAPRWQTPKTHHGLELAKLKDPAGKS
jgi:hypothetical protein